VPFWLQLVYPFGTIDFFKLSTKFPKFGGEVSGSWGQNATRETRGVSVCTINRPPAASGYGAAGSKSFTFPPKFPKIGRQIYPRHSVKFHFLTLKSFPGTEVKLWFKFGENRTYSFWDTAFLVFFQNSGRRPSWISKIPFFMIFSRWGYRLGYSYQIWSISEKPFRCYCHICKFRLEGGGHLGFCKISFLTRKSSLGCRDEAPVQIWWQSVKQFLRYCVFGVFQNGGRRPSWISKISLFMTYSRFGYRMGYSCQILSISDKPFRCYCHICKFQLEPGGHLGFYKISFFTLKSHLGCPDEAPDEIWWQSDEWFWS
jgi:hypothetical protein